MDTNQQVIDILMHGEVRPTANRIVVAQLLAASSRPLSLSELEDLSDTLDKSTIFRTLSLFRDHHIVHVIDDGSACPRYELCVCPEHDDNDDRHVHFYCEHCHKSFCLHDIPVPDVANIPLPKGYSATSINYVIKGICAECSSRHIE